LAGNLHNAEQEQPAAQAGHHNTTSNPQGRKLYPPRYSGAIMQRTLLDTRPLTSATNKGGQRRYLALAVVSIMTLAVQASAAIVIKPPCALRSGNRTVTICNPGSSAMLSLPVHVVAGTTDSNPVTSMQVLVDGRVVYQASANTVDVYLNSLPAGAHKLVVRANDSLGTFSSAIPFFVTNHAGLERIRHIIVFVQENRSFDHYFGKLGQYRVSKGLPNAIDGVPAKAVLYNSEGQPVSPYHLRTVCTENLSPAWDPSWLSVNSGKMDGFLRTTGPTSLDPSSTRPMGHYDHTDLPYYYELATQFATSDRFFSSVLTQTIPNRMYLFAGTSFGHVSADPPPAGGWTQTTIFDRLDQAGVSWKYYYQDKGSYLPEWSTYQRSAAKMQPIANYYNDIQNEATLPSVIFIERAGPSGLDEHPGFNTQKGAERGAQIINALMASPSWASSVFILTYDEGGKFYDHVIPASMVPPDNIPPMINAGEPQGDFAHTGFRVPILVISPWVKPHYVSHTWRDLTSILRLIEVRFNLPPLTLRDANADSMMEFFNFNTPQLLTAPPLPAQPTSGACSYSLEKAPGY
jgi:phospholipase C